MGFAPSREVIEEFEMVTPDVLDSDIGMPDEGGYQLIRQTRALPGGRGGISLLGAYLRKSQ
jgi:CheY-like chemotaxis protein